MITRHHGRGMACALLAAAAPIAPAAAAAAEDTTVLNEVTVTGTREGELKSEQANSVTVLKQGTIQDIKPTHPSELFSRVPGATILPTTGEGHTTGIRQPISTDPVYLFLEDGVPIRSTGFFNHNALYEVNLPQADGIEVIRGPGSALQGSDAIGGVINVLTRPPSLQPSLDLTLEAGTSGWYRMLGSAASTFDETGLRGDINVTHSDGWRDATEYDRQSATIRVDQGFSNGAMLKTVLTGTNIDQQTGANSRLSLSDYKNNPETNYTPIAFRQVEAMRLSSSYEVEKSNGLFTVTPYARYTDMTLLPSWQLSYEPVLYETGHTSFGTQAKMRYDFEPWRTRVVSGVDLEYTSGYRKEWYLNTTKSGNIYTSYSKAYMIYDYEVDYMQASPYVHVETSPFDRLRLTAGLRYDISRFDYQNNMSTVEGDRFNRAADTSLSYAHPSPSLGATYAFSDSFNAFANYKHAFRVPSESQLFRSGKSEDTTDLAPVKVNSYEVGLRGPSKGPFTWELSAYYMQKTDDILTSTDTSGVVTVTNSGNTSHTGVELGVGWQIAPEWRVDLAWSYAIHKYDQWTASGISYDGNDIPLAPRLTGNMVVEYRPSYLPDLKMSAEWVHMGSYYIDDANTTDYDGHDLFNVRASYEFTKGMTVYGRIYNLTDETWATTGMLRYGKEEYAPGLPRTFFAGISMAF